jgi:site-specific DNA-cytosine methylase
LESVPHERWRKWEADLWWLSPPCQPFTRRGLRRDLADHRTQGLMSVMRCVAEFQPRYVALENVPGFQQSQAHARWIETLEHGGYEVRQQILCPTSLGVPNRRPRFYLVAAREGKLDAPHESRRHLRTLMADCLEADVADDLWIEKDLVERYRAALDIVDMQDPEAETSCFTSAYGRSPVRSGSYLRTPRGIRRFSPREILRLLGFPDTYRLPDHLSRRRAWSLVGNSLSLVAVRHVLSVIPELREAAIVEAGITTKDTKSTKNVS